MRDSADVASAAASMPGRDLPREVERFLYEEAALLDQWQLQQWLDLFTDDARYYVPATDVPTADPRDSLGLIDDDRSRLKGRVDRLLSAKAYREFPWSRTRRFITNVRVLETGDSGITAEASFLVYRFRKGEEQTFVGHFRYRLLDGSGDGSFRIAEKGVILDQEALRPQGTLSIIL